MFLDTYRHAQGAGYDKHNVHTITVSTPGATYNVHAGVGILPTLADRIEPFRRGRVFVLTSPPIWALWSEPFLASFASGPQPTILFLPPGESCKRLGHVEQLLETLAAAGADRSSLLVAFGGGIVGDVGGFLAGIYMRGIPYVQVPTTLLAQVDSSVGGKTGANLAAGKNLVGLFHHPKAVYADADVLATLPANELRAGLMESVKAAIIRDPDLFLLLETRLHELLDSTPDPALLVEVVSRSVAIKAVVVNQDERESGPRMILNFGHTVGHAIEAVTQYSALLHGEAVGWGMLVAITIATARGLMRGEETARARALILALGPMTPFDATPEALLQAAGRDKKNSAGQRRFVLPRGIGDALVVEDVTAGELLQAIAAMLQEVHPLQSRGADPAATQDTAETCLNLLAPAGLPRE